MRIAVPYWVDEIQKAEDRSSFYTEEANRKFLHIWQTSYKNSGNTLPTVLLTDAHTEPPDFWEGDVARVTTEPDPDHVARSNDMTYFATHKQAWVKAHAYEVCGKCTVIENDIILFDKIDELEEFHCDMAMVRFDLVQEKGVWDYMKDSKNRKRKGLLFQGGVIVQNSSLIASMYEDLYNRMHERWLHIRRHPIGAKTEFMLSAINNELGKVLSPKYNYPARVFLGESPMVEELLDIPPGVKGVHFMGAYKRLIIPYAKKYDLWNESIYE